jgi:hypothetical protein
MKKTGEIEEIKAPENTEGGAGSGKSGQAAA